MALILLLRHFRQRFLLPLPCKRLLMMLYCRCFRRHERLPLLAPRHDFSAVVLRHDDTPLTLPADAALHHAASYIPFFRRRR